jgi:hypothetical protein
MKVEIENILIPFFTCDESRITGIFINVTIKSYIQQVLHKGTELQWF